MSYFLDPIKFSTSLKLTEEQVELYYNNETHTLTIPDGPVAENLKSNTPGIGDRFLIMDSSIYFGIYELKEVTKSPVAYVLERSQDFRRNYQVKPGIMFFSVDDSVFYFILSDFSEHVDNETFNPNKESFNYSNI